MAIDLNGLRGVHWSARSGFRAKRCCSSLKPSPHLKLCNGVQVLGNHVYAWTSRQCMDVYHFVWTCFGNDLGVLAFMVHCYVSPPGGRDGSSELFSSPSETDVQDRSGYSGGQHV